MTQKMMYKDGIYEGDYGISYFVKDDRVLLKHLGIMYKASPLFLFGEYRYPLTKDMDDKFEIVYNHKEIKKW